MDLVSSISELKDLRGELKDIEKRIHRLKKESDVAGRSEDTALQKILQERIEYSKQRKTQIHSRLNELQQVVDTAEITARERRVLTLYYIDGFSWQQVAFRIGEVDEQVPRRIRNRLLRKTNKIM